jgi:phosphoglycolate phosphatase-like HAD superfamily hydrolase
MEMNKEAPMGQGYELFKARSQKQAPIVIFDLDGTVIDSGHRHLSKPDGSIDLAHWIENCTPEKIFADKLLPLARAMRAMHKAGHHIVICTARVMGESDLAYLANNGLPYHGLLSRAEGDNRADAQMKVCLLDRYLFNLGYSSIREANCIMFDDNLSVLEAMRQQGVIVINATKENARRVA